jgi:LysR family transcriptional regulator, cell division regulator
MIPSPSDLNYFIEVSHTLNISRAAERLGISQPTLTLAVKRLEHSFGVPLLIRSKSGVRLTQAGLQLVSQARLLLHEWERIRGDAIKNESEVRGRYIIGCHPSVALYCVPDFLPDLLQDNPALEIKLVHDLSRRITEDVISFKVDFGIVVNPWQHPDLIIKPLLTDEITLWTSRKPTPLQDPTSGDGVLICDPELVQSQVLLKQIAKRGLVFRRIVTTSSLELITALVSAGSGIGILPGRVAQSMELKLLMKDAPKFADKICLIYRADAQRSKASRLVAKKIEREISASPVV